MIFVWPIRTSKCLHIYAKVYADFTIFDGTLNVTVYDLNLMQFTNVDCLGKNVIAGVLIVSMPLKTP